MTEDIKSIITSRKQLAEDYLSAKREKWTEYESLFNGTLADNLSGQAKSQVFDHKLSTLALDRSARVMSQLPVGKVKAISRNDEAASKLMNLTLDKYVIPNANSQFDFLTKLRMVDLYSNIYGNFFAMVDWDVRPDGYEGPDLFLIPIRDVFPQVGAVSLEDSDYIIIRTWKPLSFFKNLKNMKGFVNGSKVYNILKNKAGDKQARDDDSRSSRDTEEFPSNADSAKGKGYYEVLSMFEKDRWVDYVPSADEIIRDIKNPHENGELPVINKYSIPLLDDFMAIGDFERGKTMQYAINSLWNLYLDGVKVSIFPPVLLDKDKIADSSSVKWAAAAKWLMKNGGAQGAQVMNLTPQGTSTFNNVYQIITSSLLNMFGTTDTSVSENVDPGFGKTPQALQMQAKRENARDNVDRFYMEQFLKKVMKKFVNLLAKKKTSSIQVRMFTEEIDELVKMYPEFKDSYDENTGKITIDKSKTGSLLYDYEIVSGSTYALDQKEQQENLSNLLTAIMNQASLGPDGKLTSPIIAAVAAEGKKIMVGELFTRILSNSGIQDWDKIVVDQKDDSDAILENDAQKFAQILQQMGGVNGVPTSPMSSSGPMVPQINNGQPSITPEQSI